MNFDDYQKEALSSAIYPERATGSRLAVVYCALGLSEEAGETAGKIKKMIRDNDGIIDEEFRVRVARELGDVLWYVSALSREIGMSLSEVAELNIEKICDRKERGTLRGSGDDR